MNATIERIPTGLTKNYVSYWDEKQALKEAMQNIAYGVVKSGKGFQAEWDNGIGKIRDFHTGFGKNMLYIGESEQRDDEQGLGNFGEGWKIFLLVMAREGKFHRVDTVGFSFWGEMEETPHGTEVLVIHVEPNDVAQGTKVTVECSEDTFYKAIDSFGILQGIESKYLNENSIIPDRRGELWINGVRIENGEDTNPLELHYAYNLTDRSMMNRDRSQVNTAMAYTSIKNVVGSRNDIEFIKDFIMEAKNGNNAQDIQRGPNITSYTKDMWIYALEQVYGEKIRNMVLPSNNPHVNKEAQYREYTILNLPHQWNFELNFMLGIKPADEVINSKPVLEPVSLEDWQQKRLHSAKLKVKRLLKLHSIHDLPPIEVVKKIEINDNVNARGIYDREIGKVFLAEQIFNSPRLLFRVLLHECVHWKSGWADNTEMFTSEFEEIICDLMGF